MEYAANTLEIRRAGLIKEAKLAAAQRVVDAAKTFHSYEYATFYPKERQEIHDELRDALAEYDKENP